MVHRDIATAKFNLRECCKQLLLLEEHLVDEKKRCPDCISKHCLLLEAYIDEGFQLSPNEFETKVLNELREASNTIQSSIKTGATAVETAHRIRMFRKSLMPRVF